MTARAGSARQAARVVLLLVFLVLGVLFAVRGSWFGVVVMAVGVAAVSTALVRGQAP